MDCKVKTTPNKRGTLGAMKVVFHHPIENTFAFVGMRVTWLITSENQISVWHS